MRVHIIRPYDEEYDPDYKDIIACPGYDEWMVKLANNILNLIDETKLTRSYVPDKNYKVLIGDDRFIDVVDNIEGIFVIPAIHKSEMNTNIIDIYRIRLFNQVYDDFRRYLKSNTDADRIIVHRLLDLYSQYHLIDGTTKIHYSFNVKLFRDDTYVPSVDKINMPAYDFNSGGDATQKFVYAIDRQPSGFKAWFVRVFFGWNFRKIKE